MSGFVCKMCQDMYRWRFFPIRWKYRGNAQFSACHSPVSPLIPSGFALPVTWNIAIANQVITDLDRHVINGVVGYGAAHPGFRFRDIRFLQDEDVPGKLCSQDFDGAIINFTKLSYDQLDKEFPKIPMVNVGSDKLSDAIPSVCGLRGEGSQNLISHLRQQGYRRFVYIDAVPVDADNVRLTNLRALLEPMSETLDAYYLAGFDVEGVTEAHIEEITHWLREKIDPEIPTAAITYDGYRAAAVVAALHRLEISIPETVGVAAYIDTRLGIATVPSISCIESPGYEIGYAAMHLLHTMLEGKAPPREPVEIAGGSILVRGSTAKPDIFRDEVKLATEFMEKHCANQITVDDCLAHLGTVSRSSFYRSFSQQMGMPPGEYLRSLKVKRAKELLITTPFSITRIAELCGYSSRTQLNNTFGLVVGKSPTQYRKSMQGGGKKRQNAKA